MDNAPYPLILSSQTSDISDPAVGRFQWNFDNSIVPRSVKSDLFIQLYNIQMSRQFPNVYGEGQTLTFFYTQTPSVFYTITIDSGFYSDVSAITTAMGSKSAIRTDTGVSFPNPLTFTVFSATTRIMSIDNTNASLDLTILPTGLALRLGICIQSLTVPYVGTTKTLGTWDILFPKQIYICSNKSLQLDNSNDSSLMTSRKIIASIANNANYGDIIPFERPFITQPLRNNSIDYIDIEMTDENFTPLPFYNTFALTFMFYKD